MSDITALVINQDKENGFLYETLLETSEALKSKDSSFRKVKTTFYDEYAEGTKKASYDFVVATFFNADICADDVEMQEDIYNFYATAPVFAWVIPAGDEAEGLKTLFSKTHAKSHVVTYEGDENDAKAAAVLQAFEWAEGEYNTLSQDTVKKLFDKYDKDGSGAIDKDELKQLCEELGRSLTDDELATALKDLDLNKDGVVDFSEFKRWWFSGFKSYSGAKRSMIKMKKNAANALEAIIKGDMSNPLTEELKLKKHSVEVAFNAPESAGTKFCFSLYPGGDKCHSIHQDLKSKYNTTVDKEEMDKMLKEFGDKETFDTMQWGYMELRLKMKGDSSELAKRLLEHKEGINSLHPFGKIALPKATSNGEYLEIGTMFPCPAELLKNIEYDKLSAIVDQIKGVDQRVHVDLELGTSCKDIIKGDGSLIAEAVKGFNLKFNLDVVENFKKVIYEVIKNPDQAGPLGPIAAFIAPLVLMQANAKIELGSDAFGDIKELSMMEPFLANFGQLFEGMAGGEVDAMLEERCDLSVLEEGALNEKTKMAMEFIHTLFDIFKEMNESGEIEFSGSIPNIASLNFNVRSEDLGTALHLGAKLAYDGKFKPRYEYATQ